MLIKIGQVENGRAPVIVECFEPGIIPENEVVNWIEIKEKPSPVEQIGKTPHLFYNTETGQLFYEYEERSLTPEEKIQQLESALVEMTTLAAEQEQRNLQNEQAIMELTTLVGGMTNV